MRRILPSEVEAFQSLETVLAINSHADLETVLLHNGFATGKLSALTRATKLRAVVQSINSSAPMESVFWAFTFATNSTTAATSQMKPIVGFALLDNSLVETATALTRN